MSDDDERRPKRVFRGRRAPGAGKIKVPVGLEKLLFHAARDEQFKARLLADRAAAIAETGIKLRGSELAMVDTVSDDELNAMIENLVPDNPRKRKFMGLVAAAATSLAAGTAALAGCGDDEVETEQHTPDAAGNGADTDIDGDTDTDTDGDTDTDSEMDGGIDAGDTDSVDTDVPDGSADAAGADAKADIDGEFE